MTVEATEAELSIQKRFDQVRQDWGKCRVKHELAMQKYRAAILSDGNLSLNGSNAYFTITLSDNKDNLVQRKPIPIEDLLEFLRRFVSEALQPLEIKPCNGHPRVKIHIGKSKTANEWLPGVTLITRNSELNTELWRECYHNGKKEIPEGFILTDVFLAWFFMLDGNSKWQSGGGPGVDVFLLTQGYSLHSVELFEKQLHSFGLNTSRSHAPTEDGAGVVVRIIADSTDSFMKRIDPHVIPPYRYKIKYRGSCPAELAERYKKHYKEYMEEWCSKNKVYRNEYKREWNRKKRKEQALTSIQEDFCNLKAKIVEGRNANGQAKV